VDKINIPANDSESNHQKEQKGVVSHYAIDNSKKTDAYAASVFQKF
jgi:hypothetical protein